MRLTCAQQQDNTVMVKDISTLSLYETLMRSALVPLGLVAAMSMSPISGACIAFSASESALCRSAQCAITTGAEMRQHAFLHTFSQAYKV